jgi:hypothetical protein
LLSGEAAGVDLGEDAELDQAASTRSGGHSLQPRGMRLSRDGETLLVGGYTTPIVYAPALRVAVPASGGR